VKEERATRPALAPPARRRLRATLAAIADFDPVREHYGTARPLLIAVTGWKKPSDRILAQLAGFNHHLPKPFESHQLLELLEPLVSGSPNGR